MTKERPQGSLISYFSNRAKKEGGINLAQGTPGFPPPAGLLDSLSKLSSDNTLHQYAPGLGNFLLLELMQKDLAPTAPVTQDNLLVLQGATEGVFLTFFYLTTILEKPYSALTFDPVYESYPKLAEMFKVPFEIMDFEPDLSINFEKMEGRIKEKNVKVMFITSPGNPLGKIWSREEMEKVIGLAREHGFYIIFDAVYKDLYFGDVPPFNPLGLGYEGLFFVDSYSKMLSITGWRIGYIVTDKTHMVKIRAIHDYTGLCAPSILQTAIARYLDEHDYGKGYVEEARKKCRRAYLFMKEEMADMGFPVVETQGGYFLWTRLPRGWEGNDAFEFALELYEKAGVAVVPGENFSLSKKDYIRVNIGTELPVVKDAAARIREFLGA